MILKDDIGHTLQVKIAWLAPDEIQVTFKEYRTLEQIKEINYYLTPTELEKLGDLIRDTLCH